MTLEELKNKEVSQDQRAENLVKSLGLEGNERSVVIGLKKDDRFRIVAMNKMDLAQREGQTTKFVPITYTTNTGASIGAKQFVGVTIDDDAPAVGSTPTENAKFLVWCIDHNVTFKVKSMTSETIEAQGGIPEHVKRTYKLEVEDYE